MPLSDCWVNTANPGDQPVNKLGSNNIKAVYLCYDSAARRLRFIPELKRITTCWRSALPSRVHSLGICDQRRQGAGWTAHRDRHTHRDRCPD